MTDEFKPPFGGVIQALSNGPEGAPYADNPYYAVYRDGMFVKRNLLIGSGLAAVKQLPNTLPLLGSSVGSFDFDEKLKVPAWLMGQVVDFFSRVYDSQSTEAAVLLTMHRETKEWRVFVPTQLVTHGGVNYVFDPGSIQPPWIIVGSIHSHCDFGAGHSSTDTGDAADFDGLHMTIGHIKQDIPQIVAMVALNKQFLHFADKDFDEVFDFSEVRQHKAPDWWFRYVEEKHEKRKPVGFELFEKFDKPTVVKEEKRASSYQAPSKGYTPTGYNPNNWVWGEKEGRMVWRGDDKPKFKRNYVHDEDSKPYADRINPWLDDLTVAELLDLGYDWDQKLSAWVFADGRKVNDNTTRSRNVTGIEWTDREPEYKLREVVDQWDEDYWEEKLGVEIVEALMSEGFLTEDEVDEAIDSPVRSGTIEYWRALTMKKATTTLNVLHALGIDATININKVTVPAEPKKMPLKLLKPGETIQKDGATITVNERKN